MMAVRGLKFSVFLYVYKITLLPSFLFLFRPCQQLRSDSATKKSCSLWFIWKAHLNFYTRNWYRCASHKFESVWESVNLVTWTTTYPSPKSTLTLTSHLGQNCHLGEGQVVVRRRMLFHKKTRKFSEIPALAKDNKRQQHMKLAKRCVVHFFYLI